MDNEITLKIKALLKLSGKRNKDLAEYMGISAQSLQNKFNRGSFSADDLIKIASFTGYELAFIEKSSVCIIRLDDSCLRSAAESE